MDGWQHQTPGEKTTGKTLSKAGVYRGCHSCTNRKNQFESNYMQLLYTQNFTFNENRTVLTQVHQLGRQARSPVKPVSNETRAKGLKLFMGTVAHLLWFMFMLYQRSFCASQFRFFRFLLNVLVVFCFDIVLCCFPGPSFLLLLQTDTTY